MRSGLGKAVITRSELKISWVLDAHTICMACHLSGACQDVNSASLLILLSALLAPVVGGLSPNV